MAAPLAEARAGGAARALERATRPPPKPEEDAGLESLARRTVLDPRGLWVSGAKENICTEENARGLLASGSRSLLFFLFYH